MDWDGGTEDACCISVRGFPVHFFSNEGDPREPIHIHVAKAGADAKFWLYPGSGFGTIPLMEVAAEAAAIRSLSRGAVVLRLTRT
ncbi:DUF4160 domain-containing protein [Phyllobacterium phragmitis]|uniref:DUF4160 domain-containing protein n=1 Tax=Phyllobacterium phragmitis TaxID=2670329 RepID=UPI0038B36A89